VNVVKPASRWLVAAVAAALIPAGAQDSSPAGLEYQIKATFLLTIAKFVDWPPDKLDPSSPILVGIYGKDPFGITLDQTLRGKSVAGRPLTVQRLRGLDQAGPCHILFISAAERKRLGQILNTLGDGSVLTVGEMANFAEQGGMVNFVTKDNSVSLEINPSAAERANIKISSKLLRLARVVEGPDQARGK